MSREAISPFKSINLSILDNDEQIKNITATPCVLYNAKVAPFTNFAIKGFLWYQGESNRDNADLYQSLMPAFVKDLRNKWNRGELPFYFVEIAPFNYEGADGTSAARMREVQLQNMKDIPNSGMVSTLDIGHPVFIHPMDKETVGNRLALWALAKTYGKKGFGYASPIYKSMEISDNKIYINVENAQRGLCPMWTSLKGFEIAGEDKVFYPAFAEIETSTTRLTVSSDKVPHPVAVRYAYKNYAEANVFNIHGLPLIPFRTDNW
jgi:sialate O-acetylesterase